MNIAICGDSFLSSSNSHPNTHFGELLAKKINANVHYYSSPGMSNASICAQIDQAIDQKHDLIIFNTTFSGRVEIPFDDTEEYTYSRKNISTPYLHDDFNKNIRLLSLPLNVDWKNDQIMLSSMEKRNEKVNALIDYINYIYVDNWKKQTDTYLIMGILKKLELSKIDYIWCLDMLQSYTESFDWVNIKNDTRAEFSEIYKKVYVNMDQDPGYHTLPEHQILLSEIIYNKL